MGDDPDRQPLHPAAGCVVGVLLIAGWIAVLVFILALADSWWGG